MMKKDPLEGLESVAWDGLSHAYGGAEDVPGHLRTLVNGAAKKAGGAISDLFAAILHQGTIYTATIPAIPFLARIAAHPEARGRKEALWFLIGFGESVRSGWSKTPKYLPRGTNMKDFDARCRATMAAACETVAGVVGDPAPRLRALAAQAMQAAGLPIPPKIVARLRKQLGAETNNEAKASIIRALVAAGALSKAELAALREKSSPGVAFAAAWKAVQSGAEIEPWHFETLAKHWSPHAGKLEKKGACGDAMVELAAARKAELLPLLNALASRQNDAAQRAAVAGAAALTGMSRSAVDDALEVLFKVAQKPAAGVRRRLVHTLGDLGMGGRVADVIFALATSDPSPTWPQNVKRIINEKTADTPHSRDIRADAALALFRAGDARWEQLLTKAHSATDMVGDGRSCLAMPNALERAGAPCPAVLLAMARKRIAAGTHASLWCELLATWPAAEAAALADAVIAALPKAVHKASLLLAAWRCEAAVPALKTLAKKLDGRGSSEAMWPHIALAQITGDSRHFGRARAAHGRKDGEGKAGCFLGDLLEAWAKRPDENFHALCRTLITGRAAVSYPGREEQLLAIRALAGVDDLARVWPTLLAIIDEAERPLANAVALGVELAASAPKALRVSLAGMLESIVVKGRSTWSGKDECAPVTAMGALLRLQPGHPKALTVNLAGLRKAAREDRLLPLVPRICETLENIAAQKPACRKKVTDAISRLLASDVRVITLSDEDCVREDNAFRRTLAETKTRLDATAPQQAIRPQTVMPATA